MWQKEPARWTLLLFDCFVPAKVWNKPKPEPSFESSRYFTGLFEEVEWNRPVFQWSTVSQLAGKTKQLLISLQHPQFHSLPLQSATGVVLTPVAALLALLMASTAGDHFPLWSLTLLVHHLSPACLVLISTPQKSDRFLLFWSTPWVPVCRASSWIPVVRLIVGRPQSQSPSCGSIFLCSTLSLLKLWIMVNNMCIFFKWVCCWKIM